MLIVVLITIVYRYYKYNIHRDLYNNLDLSINILHSEQEVKTYIIAKYEIYLKWYLY